MENAFRKPRDSKKHVKIKIKISPFDSRLNFNVARGSPGSPRSSPLACFRPVRVAAACSLVRCDDVAGMIRGDGVEICGLQARHLNGCRGRIVKRLKDERWAVLLNGSERKIISVKGGNIKLCKDDKTAAAATAALVAYSETFVEGQGRSLFASSDISEGHRLMTCKPIVQPVLIERKRSCHW